MITCCLNQGFIFRISTLVARVCLFISHRFLFSFVLLFRISFRFVSWFWLVFYRLLFWLLLFHLRVAITINLVVLTLRRELSAQHNLFPDFRLISRDDSVSGVSCSLFGSVEDAKEEISVTCLFINSGVPIWVVLFWKTSRGLLRLVTSLWSSSSGTSIFITVIAWSWATSAHSIKYSYSKQHILMFRYF